MYFMMFSTNKPVRLDSAIPTAWMYFIPYTKCSSLPLQQTRCKQYLDQLEHQQQNQLLSEYSFRQSFQQVPVQEKQTCCLWPNPLPCSLSHLQSCFTCNVSHILIALRETQPRVRYRNSAVFPDKEWPLRVEWEGSVCLCVRVLGEDKEPGYSQVNYPISSLSASTVTITTHSYISTLGSRRGIFSVGALELFMVLESLSSWRNYW